jgi:hypothetical protein
MTTISNVNVEALQISADYIALLYICQLYTTIIYANVLAEEAESRRVSRKPLNSSSALVGLQN